MHHQRCRWRDHCERHIVCQHQRSARQARQPSPGLVRPEQCALHVVDPDCHHHPRRHFIWRSYLQCDCQHQRRCVLDRRERCGVGHLCRDTAAHGQSGSDCGAAQGRRQCDHDQWLEPEAARWIIESVSLRWALDVDPDIGGRGRLLGGVSASVAAVLVPALGRNVECCGGSQCQQRKHVLHGCGDGHDVPGAAHHGHDSDAAARHRRWGADHLVWSEFLEHRAAHRVVRVLERPRERCYDGGRYRRCRQSRIEHPARMSFASTERCRPHAGRCDSQQRRGGDAGRHADSLHGASGGHDFSERGPGGRRHLDSSCAFDTRPQRIHAAVRLWHGRCGFCGLL
eukprot:comp15395_c0_seq1/m.23345 comp15395_c0_seq1/g.23345  ORF comp15395_c0_seq1/g.23345 comp15395_c0_seq1/m.23345 type:complete len:341 (-) comp15395_c0_seq1:7430-8452(-)